MVYNLVPINDLMLIKIPQSWSYQNGEKCKSANADDTIRLTISCYENQTFENVEVEFKNTSANYFATFDKHYKAVSEIIKEDRVLLKLYNTGKTLEYHAITYAQPMLTRYVVVCFVFISMRNLEDTDIEVFETVTSSLTYKIADLPK